MYHILAFSGDQCKPKPVMYGVMALLMASILWLPSATAFVGDVIGADLNGVTCTNTTTGATAPGDFFPGGVYDCETLPAQIGDLVEVTLSGTATTVTAPGVSDCIDVMENPVSPPAILLTEGACFHLIGSIVTGFGDINNPPPSFEVDAFILQAADVSGLRLSLVGDEGIQFISLLGDVNSSILLTCILTPESCRGDVTVETSAIGISGSAPGSYVLELRVVAVNDSGMPVSQTATPSADTAAAVQHAVQQYIRR